MSPHAVLVDFIDLEHVFGDVLEGPNKNMNAGRKFLLVNNFSSHAYRLRTKKSGSRTPRVKLTGKGNIIGWSQLGKQAKIRKAPATACGTSRLRSNFFLSPQDKVSRKPTPAAISSVKVVNIYTSPLRFLLYRCLFSIGFCDPIGEL
tara:strand:- start:780 stop:1220 length:441 start_codon:yes stop_codon:yes gene_type:complete